MAITNTEQQTSLVTECVICGAELTFATLEISELLECYDCGTELEVQSITPLILIEAPCEGEDWGQ